MGLKQTLCRMMEYPLRRIMSEETEDIFKQAIYLALNDGIDYIRKDYLGLIFLSILSSLFLIPIGMALYHNYIELDFLISFYTKAVIFLVFFPLSLGFSGVIINVMEVGKHGID